MDRIFTLTPTLSHRGRGGFCGGLACFDRLKMSGGVDESGFGEWEIFGWIMESWTLHKS